MKRWICSFVGAAMSMLSLGDTFAAQSSPAEKYCELWNKEQLSTKLKCEAHGSDAVFSAVSRAPDEIWGRHEFNLLRRAIGRTREDDDARVSVVLKTSDGICRRVSKELPAALRESAQREWKELGEPIDVSTFWHRRVWDAAPKEKCGEAQPGYRAELPPDLGNPRAGSAAEWVCRVVRWGEWNKGCKAVSDVAVMVWLLDYAYEPGAAQKEVEWFEWKKLAPNLLFYWAVEDWKRLDTVTVMLKNGKCKTVSSQFGLDLERKWTQVFEKGGSMSQDAMMTSWFAEGWANAREGACPEDR